MQLVRTVVLLAYVLRRRGFPGIISLCPTCFFTLPFGNHFEVEVILILILVQMDLADA